MAKSGKVMIEFNVKNGKYAIYESNAYSTPKALTYLTKIALNKNLTTTPIYGDGEEILNLVNDKGSTGTLGMTAEDVEYNKAIGINKELSNGLGEITQKSVIKHAIYFETEYVDSDQVTKVKKVWLLGVEASAPSKEYDQNTDNINPSTIEYGLTVKGEDLMDTAGTSVYKDDNGMAYKCYKLSAIPTDTGYATFGDTVPTPKVKA